AWVIQADAMDRDFLGMTWLKSQVQAVNPFLILVLIPTFAYVLYPLIGKFWAMTPLRKIGIGLFMTAGAFALSGWIETGIVAATPDALAALTAVAPDIITSDMSLAEAIRAITDPDLGVGWTDEQVSTAMANVGMPSIGWQFLAYLVLTAAEVMVSITSLEFAYTQAPKKMKSFIMGIYFLGVSLGNLFTSGVNFFIQNDDGSVKLAGADYYWFFTLVMLVTSVIYIFFAIFYRGRTFIQGDDGELEAEAEAEAIGNT
ncbi:MAG: hypothetical protein AAF432_16390, partial [Planctomycetota bacterium]